MKRKSNAVASYLLAAGVVVILFIIFFPKSGVDPSLRIQVLDPVEGMVIVTNEGPETVDVSVTYQVLTNRVWYPPTETLFKHPVHLLSGNRSALMEDPSGDASALRFQFSDQSHGVAPWRVLVLCQKHYDETGLSPLRYLVERHLTKRGRFANKDHRGPYDTWLTSDSIQPMIND